MRSVLVHLWQIDEPAVAAVLDSAYPQQRSPWVRFVNGDACLYIDFYHDGPIEHVDWDERFRPLGGNPSVSVIADISGRHDGRPEVRELVALLLSRFRGVAENDNSTRFWSREEVAEDRLVNGERFAWRRPLA